MKAKLINLKFKRKEKIRSSYIIFITDVMKNRNIVKPRSTFTVKTLSTSHPYMYYAVVKRTTVNG